MSHMHCNKIFVSLAAPYTSIFSSKDIYNTAFSGCRKNRFTGIDTDFPFRGCWGQDLQSTVTLPAQLCSFQATAMTQKSWSISSTLQLSPWRGSCVQMRTAAIKLAEKFLHQEFTLGECSDCSVPQENNIFSLAKSIEPGCYQWKIQWCVTSCKIVAQVLGLQYCICLKQQT